jgi:hypothetical protein
VQQSLEKLDTSKAKDSTGKISELAGNAGIPDYGKVITIFSFITFVPVWLFDYLRSSICIFGIFQFHMEFSS